MRNGPFSSAAIAAQACLLERDRQASSSGRLPVQKWRVDFTSELANAVAGEAELDWQPVRLLRRLYEVAPLLYEDVRYRAEMLRKCLSAMRSRTKFRPTIRDSSSTRSSPKPHSGKRPAILIGMHWLEIGGAEKLGFDTVRWAVAAGLRVFIVTGEASQHRLAWQLPDHPDVTLIRLDRDLPDDKWPRFVTDLITAENIRLVHIHHCRPLYGCLPHIRATTAWVKIIDSTHIVEYADGGYPRISGIRSDQIDLHHVVSRKLVNYYRDTFDIRHKVALGRMMEYGANSKIVQAFSMLSGQASLQVSFVGRLHYQKRPVVLVEILRSLADWARKSDVDLRASVVGEGVYLSQMKRLLERYDLTDRVRLEPSDYNVPALLERSDILLLPSSNEGLALVCYEAVAHGCIPISTDVGAQREIIPQDLLLPLAPRQTVSACTALIDRMWRDDVFLNRQKAALHEVWEKLTADPTAQQILSEHYRAAANVAELDISH